MSEVALQFECSVEADVSLAFAWSLRVDVAIGMIHPQNSRRRSICRRLARNNFVAGPTTICWLIREVRFGESFIIEMELDGAMLSFEWRFDTLPENRTRLTQRIVLTGENAPGYVDQVKAGFGSTLADGMRRIAAEIERARSN